ncbi:DUF4349 domain-containing protein [Candidatus Pacearchaeota archaeon]|nr:DUF4349 domain-containing protein [Candidatus Pacearchaeota archaeon]
MGVKKQFAKIKENWLIIVLAIVLFLFMSGGSGFLGNVMISGMDKSWSLGGSEMMGLTDSMERGYYPGLTNSDFAPEVEERKLIKTTRLSTEIKRGLFNEAETELKNIIISSDAYLLNEQVNKYGSERKSYYQGSYQLKVDTEKYDSVISQLKKIGKVESFNENTNDVTGRYTNLEIEIEVEKQRLLRYEEIYGSAKSVSDKIELSDRIFNQERTIKYLEDSLKNIDQRIDYSTIYFSMNEERSEYYDIVFVKLSSLIKSFIGSFNNLIQLIFVLIPWGIALWIIRFGWKFFKKK